MGRIVSPSKSFPFSVAARHRRGLIVVAVTLLIIIVGLAMLPLGLFRSQLERMATSQLGRPVTIAAISRIDPVSFSPRIAISGVRIGQPAWAGAGTMAEVAEIRLTLPILPALTGSIRPRNVEVNGFTLDLVRTADGKANWNNGTESADRRSGPPDLRRLIIRHGKVRLRDAKRKVTLRAALSSDPQGGLRITGLGTHRGEPLRLALRGARLDEAEADGRYPVGLSVRSPLTRMSAALWLDRPLDIGGFDGRISASGRDLTYLDDLIEAGLFPTQPFDLQTSIHRDGSDWRLRDLRGTVGRSRLKAALHIGRSDGRTRLTGRLNAATLDFDDFASTEQRAKGTARESRLGPRLLPGTRIRLDPVAGLDGTIDFTVRRLLSRAPSPFRSIAGKVVLERSHLVIEPLSVGLTQGTMSGRIIVDQRDKTPTLDLNLSIGGATIESLIFPDGEIRGPLKARIRMKGAGDTVAQAMSHASGRVGIVVPGGNTRRDYTVFLGGDVLKSVGVAIDGGTDRVEVRCLIANFSARDGVLSPAPLALDTVLAGATGTGRITLADERIDLKLFGRAAKPGILQSTAPVRVFGTLSAPSLDIRPPRAERSGKSGLIGRIGFFLEGLKTKGDGDRNLPARKLDCDGLARVALK